MEVECSLMVEVFARGGMLTITGSLWRTKVITPNKNVGELG
jgi:hypothetical protein